MKRTSTAVFAGLCLMAPAGVSTMSASAQDAHPPKVLMIDVEYMQLGMGKAHRESERALAKVASDGKSPVHYIALDALSGQPRALFLFPYDSFEDMANTRMEAAKDVATAERVNEANRKDATLLTSKEASMYTFRPDLSHKPDQTVAEMHFWEITRVKVKTGHAQDWEEYLKILSATLDKTDPDRHLAVFRSAYGRENGGVWLLISPMASMKNVDQLFASRDGMIQKMDTATSKRYRELAEASVESSQRNLFAADPQMSYVWDSWIKADSFWQPK